VSQEELQAWVRFRVLYGLRFDIPWILGVANDPTASDLYRVPLLPAELQQVVDASWSADDLLPKARAFADDDPDFAGAWIELPRVVVAFAGDVPERRAQTEGLFGDRVIVRDARFSLAQLEGFMATVTADKTWFTSVGGEVVDIGIDEAMNIVRIHTRLPDETIERAARERFGDSGWMEFSYDGPAPWKGPLGDLEITVVDKSGEPAAVLCLVGTTDPRVQGETSMFAADGKCFFQDLAAVKWGLRVVYDFGGESQTVLADYLVPAAGVERATIVVGS
jgi:hypothetical protein